MTPLLAVKDFDVFLNGSLGLCAMAAAGKGGAGLIEIRIGDAVVRIEGTPDAGTLGAVLRSLQR